MAVRKDKTFTMKIEMDRFLKVQTVAKKRGTTVAGLINQLLSDYVLGVGLDGRPIRREGSKVAPIPEYVS